MFGHKKEKKTDRPLAAPGGDKLGVYIHIPFCKSKCDYCDFYSLAGREDQMDRYQKALLSHIAETAPMAQVPVDTIYFGGGTPSLYGEKRLKEILTALKKQLPVDKDAEITLEANPDSVDLRSLRRLRRAGFNRISLGMQSADPAELEAVHRPHTVQQTDQAVTMAKKAGFKNLSLDLIYGLPGQTEESWRATVEHALSLIPQHLSCYGLKVEEGTPLAQRVEEGEVLPDDDAQADRYLWTVGRLARAGFAQYEISNFAKPGCASRHNLKYWTLGEYAGFGPGAHSDFGGVRYAYTKDLEGYIRGVRDHAPMLSESDRIPPLDRDTEWVMLGLRTTAGLDPKAFERRFRRRFTCFLPFLDQCARAGYAVEEDGRWHLTPRGFLVSNQIIGGMLDALAADKQRRADAAARGDFRVNLD